MTDIHALPPLSLDEHDESVRIAVRALGDMRSGAAVSSPPSTSFQPTPALSIASTSSTPSLGSPSLPSEDAASSDYLSRMTTLPLVNSALRASRAAYEQGKASSRVVKYGAEMMESSISTISKPVIDRLGIRNRPVSSREFKLEDDRGRSTSVDPQGDSWEAGLRFRDPSVASSTGDGRSNTWDHDTTADHQSSPERTPTPQPKHEPPTQPPQEVVQRSRWQTMLLEAGGISAACSEENMRRLKYCLQWLQYATAHIDAQILVLRDFIVSLQAGAGTDTFLVSPSHMRKLADVKRDVVGTIRQAVDVVSQYAGGALPEPARATVRGFILHLPRRWAQASAGTVPHRQHGHAAAARKGHEVGDVASAAGSRRGLATPYSRSSSPASTAPSSPRISRSPHLPLAPLARQGVAPTAPTAGAATQAAQRILTLAMESLDMMRGVTAVVKDSLDRADTWVERLRAVGIQRQQSGDESLPEFPPLGTQASSAASRSPSPHTHHSTSVNDSELGGVAGDPSTSFGAMSLHSRNTSRYATPTPGMTPKVGNMALPPLREAIEEEDRSTGMMEVDA